jgi:hypothetical protein
MSLDALSISKKKKKKFVGALSSLENKTFNFLSKMVPLLLITSK